MAKRVAAGAAVLIGIFALWLAVLYFRTPAPPHRIPTKLLTELQALSGTLTEFKDIHEKRIAILKEDDQVLLGMIDLLLRPQNHGHPQAQRLLSLSRRLSQALDPIKTLCEFQVAQLLLWQRTLEKMRLGASRSEIATDLQELLGGVNLSKKQVQVTEIELGSIRGQIDESVPSFSDQEFRNGLAALSVVHNHLTQVVRGSDQLKGSIEKYALMLKDMNSKLP